MPILEIVREMHLKSIHKNRIESCRLSDYIFSLKIISNFSLKIKRVIKHELIRMISNGVGNYGCFTGKNSISSSFKYHCK